MSSDYHYNGQPKIVKINRLFLIGNGFDISLGLKTKYSDFLLWLLKREVINADKSGIKFAPYDKYKGRYSDFEQEYYKLDVNGYSENKLFDVIIKYKQFKIPLENIESIDNLKEFYVFCEKSGIEFNIHPSFIFMTELFKSSKENWVDIENIYFSLLKQIIKRKEENYKELIISINQELAEIIIYLKEYLTSLDVKIAQSIAEPHFKIFNEKLKNEDFLDLKKILEIKKEPLIEVGTNYFLNFNYTNSITEVLQKHPEYENTQNFIHGNLIDDEIIFGFGDEMDKFYKEIEELNDNELFKHIKSFHYFKTPNQRQLQTFLNSGIYQVCVYGHSCGLSDRVMLNEIFEHENCTSIKIYYYNDEDFTTKTMEISRHFNSNQLMRKKIVNKSSDCFIPQVDKNI
jgi:hypothetical protein